MEVKHMRKRLFALAILIALILMSAGCGSASSQTIILNSVSKFFSNDGLLEATARELSIEGNDASVRIHILNTSEEPIDSLNAKVSFLDQEGNVLYSDELDLTYDTPLESYESTTITASCSGKNVSKIAMVSIEGSQEE